MKRRTIGESLAVYGGRIVSVEHAPTEEPKDWLLTLPDEIMEALDAFDVCSGADYCGVYGPEGSLLEVCREYGPVSVTVGTGSRCQCGPEDTQGLIDELILLQGVAARLREILREERRLDEGDIDL